MASKFTITAELNLQTKNLSQVVNNLKQQFQGADLNIKIKDLAKAEASLRNISSGAKDASASMGMLGGSINQAFRRFTVVTLATGTIVGFTRALKNAVGDAIEFERELVKIAQATGQSVAQLRGLATEVGNVSSSFGVSSKELILAARSLTQAGFAADKVTGSLKILAQTELAATFDSISNTTEGAIALLNQFGKQAQKTGSEVAFLEKSFSAINQVSKEFAVESSDLVTAVRTTGAAFESAGGSLNELLALFTSVRSTTRESAESISTGFRTIFTRIQRVDTINNLKALGIQLQDVEGKFVGPMEATKRLSMALSTIDPRDFRFNLIVEELGGFRQVSKVIPLIQQFATTQKALNVAQGSSGSLAKDAQTAQLSLAVQISKTREEFLRFIRDLTETESFQGTVRTLLNMANAFIKVADTIKPLIPLLGAFAALRIGQSIIPAIASVAGGRNKKAEGGVIHKFATGGLVPGQGNGDTVPAMLTPGEFVIRKSSVKQLGVENLARVNKYAGGGKIIGSLGGVASNTFIFKDNKDIGLQKDKFQVSVRRIKIPINESIYDKLEKGGKGWEDYLAKKYGYKQYPSAAGEKNTESDFRYPIDMESESSYIDAKDFKSTSSVPIVEGYKKALSHLLYQKYKSKYKFQGASKNIINASNDGDDNFYGTKLTENSDPIISPKNMLLLFPDVKKGFALGGLIQKFALGGPAGKSRAARAITIPRIESYSFDKPAGADLDATNSKKQQYKLNAEDRLDYDVNNVNVDVSKLKVSKGLLEQYNTADDQKRGFRFEDILKETGMAKSLSQVSNARLDGITAAGDPFEAKSRKLAIGAGELEDKIYGAISDNISDPEKLARARFNANDLTENEDHIKIGRVTVFEDITNGLGAAVNTKARMGYAEEEAAKQTKIQGKAASVNAQQQLQDIVKNNFGSGFIIKGKQYSPITEKGGLHPDVAANLNQGLGGSYRDQMGSPEQQAKVLGLLKKFIVRNPVQNKASGGSIADLAWLASGGAASGTDTVPAMLTPGEYVINKKSAQAIGYGALNRMNKVGKFAQGGPVQFLNSGGMKNAFGSTTNVTAQPFANFTATTANPYPKASSGPTIDVLSSALEQSAKTIGQGAEKVTNKFGDVSDQLLLFGPAITGAISQMGMFDKATADMISATTFTFSTIKGVGGNLTQQVGKYFDLKENSKGFQMLNAGVTAYALSQSIAAGRVQYFGQTVESEGKKFASFVESLSNGSAGVSKDKMTQALTEQFKAASRVQTRQSETVKMVGLIGTALGTLGGGAAGAAIGGASSVGIGAAPGAAIGASVGGTVGGTMAEEAAAYAMYGMSLKKVTEQANALSSAMYSATESNAEFQKFFQNIDKESPQKIAQQSAKLAAAYKLQSDELSKFNSTDLASASDSVKQQFQAVSEAAKLTAKNLQQILGLQLAAAAKESSKLVQGGFIPDTKKLIQPALDTIRDKVTAEYASRVQEAKGQEKAGKAPIGTAATIEKQRDAQISAEQAQMRKSLLESVKQNLEMAKSLAIENDLRKQLIGSMQKELGINAAIEQTAYNLNQVAKTVSNIDAVFSGSLTGLKSSYDTETLKMKNPNQENLEKALKPVRAVGPIGEELSNNILDINKVMPILEAKLLQFSNATDTASGGLLNVADFVKTAFNIDPNGIVGKALVNIIETTTRGTGGGTNSVTASSTSLREPEVRKRIAETFQKFGEAFKTQAAGILDLMNQTEQEGRVIAEKINESRQKQLDLAIQGVDTFSQYIDAVSKARGRDMTLMEKNTIRNMRQYALAGSMGNNSAALGQRLNKIYADLNKGGLSTEESANLNLEAKNLTKALEGLANQSDKTSDILQEIDKVKKNRENLRELGREFGTGTAEDKDKMQQDMAAAMTVAQTGTYDSIPEEMRKGADAMLERFKDIPVFKQAQNRAIADTFMKAGNPVAAQMVLQETSTPEEMLIHQLDILFTQQILAQKTLSLIEAQRQEFLKKAQEDNTTAMGELSNAITALVKHYQDEAAAKAMKVDFPTGPKSLTDVEGEKNSLANPNATAIGSTGIGNGDFAFNGGAAAMGRRDLMMPEGAASRVDVNSVEGLNAALVLVNTQLATENTNLANANAKIADFQLILEASTFAVDGWMGKLGQFFNAQPQPQVELRAPGDMTPKIAAANGGLIYRADGGSIFQPKGTDTVPAMLTPGEFVIKKSSVDKIGSDTLSKINAGAYATGGLVSYLAEGGESIAQGGAKVNNITLKKVYDQLQEIDKRVAFLEQEYKALSVLISSGALGGGQQMEQQGGGQQMAQQGGGQQQMANQPRGNGLRSVPPQANPAATPPKDDTKADDNTPPPQGRPGTAPFQSAYGNKPRIVDGKKLTPVPPGPENDFTNGLYRNPDGRLVHSGGLPVNDRYSFTQDEKTGDLKGWRLAYNEQRLTDYNELNSATSQAQRRAIQRKQKERDIKQADVLGKAVDAGTATPEQSQEYILRFNSKNIAKQRRLQDERVKATQAEEKADPVRFKRPSATATWDPVKRIWNDEAAIAEKQDAENPDLLESRLLGLTGHKPIKPEDRPAAEAKLKALQDKKETTRVAGLTNEQIARETEAELNLAIKNKAPIAQVLSLNDKLEKARGAAQTEARTRDAERIKTSQDRAAQSKADAEKRNAEKASAETGPQIPIEIRQQRRDEIQKEELAAVEEKNKKDAEDSAKRGVSKLLPSNEDIANKLKTGLKGFQEKNIAATEERKAGEAERKQMEEEQRAKEERMNSPEGLATAAENRRKQTELLDYNKKLKTYEENKKTVAENPEVFTGARGNTLDLTKPMEPDFLRDRDKIDIKPIQGFGAFGSAGPGAIPYNVAEANSEAISRQTPEYLANRSIMRDSTAGALEYGIGRGIMQPFDLANLGINVTARQFGVDAGLPTNMAQEAFPKPTEDASHLTHAAGRVAEAAGSMFATGGAGSAATAALGIGSDVVTGVASEQLDLPPWASIGLGIAAGRATDVAVPKMQDAASSLPVQQWAFGNTPEVLKRKAQIAAENATMPKGTTRDEVLRDFRAGDVQNPASVNQNLTTPRVVDANPESDFYSHLKPSTPWPAQHGESNYERIQELNKRDALKDTKAPSTNATPVADNLSPQQSAKTNATMQTATAPPVNKLRAQEFATDLANNPYGLGTAKFNANQLSMPNNVEDLFARYGNAIGVTQPKNSLPPRSAVAVPPRPTIETNPMIKAQTESTVQAVTNPPVKPISDFENVDEILKGTKSPEVMAQDLSKALGTSNQKAKFNPNNVDLTKQSSDILNSLGLPKDIVDRSLKGLTFSKNTGLEDLINYPLGDKYSTGYRESVENSRGMYSVSRKNININPESATVGTLPHELGHRLQDLPIDPNNPKAGKFRNRFAEYYSNQENAAEIQDVISKFGPSFYGSNVDQAKNAMKKRDLTEGQLTSGALEEMYTQLMQNATDPRAAAVLQKANDFMFKTQNKASGGLITYLENGGPFHGMPRSGGAFNNFGNAMAGSLNDTSNWMTKSYNDYTQAPAQAFNDTANWMTGSFNDAASGMTDSFNGMKNMMSGNVDNVASSLSGSFEGAKNWMNGSFNDAASGMTNSFNNFAASFEKGGLISYLAKGGSPKGTDTVPAMLTPGEFVMKKEAVDKHGTDFMEKLNKGGEVPGFATGGLVNYFRNGGKTAGDSNGRQRTVADVRASQFSDPKNKSKIDAITRLQTAATGSSLMAQQAASFGTYGYGGNGMEVQQAQQGGNQEAQQQPNGGGGGLRSVPPSPTGGESGSTESTAGGGSGAPNMSEVTTALNNMSTAFTGFTDKLNALATAFSGLTVTHNVVFGGQINIAGIDPESFKNALTPWVTDKINTAIKGLRGENGQLGTVGPVAKPPGS
jgi:Phage-related minor tail protein